MTTTSQAELWYAPTKEPVAMDAAPDPWMTRALGVEIDPKFAAGAQSHGCDVLIGDFGSIPLHSEGKPW